mgnify:CR=1 FL=1
MNRFDMNIGTMHMQHLGDVSNNKPVLQSNS